VRGRSSTGPAHCLLFTVPITSVLSLILAESRHIDLFARTETWITSFSSSAELLDATSPSFTLLSFPRQSQATKSHIVGGGTAFLIREPASLLSVSTQTFKSFEMSAITHKLFSSNLTVFNVYRPPPAITKTRKPVPFSDFLTDLYAFLSLAATTPHEFLITGDFNLHLDDPTNSESESNNFFLHLTPLISLIMYPSKLIGKIIPWILSSPLTPLLCLR